MKNKSQEIKNKLKAGIAGLLLGAIFITGAGCSVGKSDDNNLESDVKIAETKDATTSKVENVDIREKLIEIINKTFTNYIIVEEQSAGETIILPDGTLATRRVGCITAPNGDNIAWLGEEYYAIYKEGKSFLNENEYPEECEMYISFKDALIDIVMDKNHKITKIGNNQYQIDDNDCNIYIIEVKNGVINNIKDTYIEFNTKEVYSSKVYLEKTDEIEFGERLDEAIQDIKQADEYFNGSELTK